METEKFNVSSLQRRSSSESNTCVLVWPLVRAITSRVAARPALQQSIKP
jgi:hypothetical protein